MKIFNDELDILFYVLFFLNIAITLVVSYLLNEFVVGSDDLIYILGGIDG